MQLADAIRRLRDFMPEREEWDGLHIVASGGVMNRQEDPPPLLCATPELAIKQWFNSTMEMLRNTQAISWTMPREPVLERWQITMMTDKGDQRLVQARYVVIAFVGVRW